MRRTWLRGLVETTKRYLVAAAAHNLGRVLLKLLGVGKPRGLQGFGRLFSAFSPTLAVVLRPHHCWHLAPLYISRREPWPCLLAG